ncbi:hypothetical protein NECAME_13179, partial [Necator americanus]
MGFVKYSFSVMQNIIFCARKYSRILHKPPQ